MAAYKDDVGGEGWMIARESLRRRHDLRRRNRTLAMAIFAVVALAAVVASIVP